MPSDISSNSINTVNDDNINRNSLYKKGTYTIVIKVGTSSICDEHTHYPKLANLSMLVEAIIELTQQGHRVILVSSGAVGTGLRRLNYEHKPSKSRAKIQAIAAVGQGKLMSKYDDLFSNFNQPIAQVLLSRPDLTERYQYINACNTFHELLNLGVVPIVNENDTICSEQLRYGDNDTLSGITAGIVNADYLFLLTDVDALYTDNPRNNPDAKPIRVVKNLFKLRQEVCVSSPGSDLGTGGMSTKLVAADIATAAGCTTIIMNGTNPKNIVNIINESSTQDLQSHPPTIGTHFLPRYHILNDREWWIRYGLAALGTIQLKPEFVRNLVEVKLMQEESERDLDQGYSSRRQSCISQDSGSIISNSSGDSHEDSGQVHSPSSSEMDKNSMCDDCNTFRNEILPVDVEDTQNTFFPNQCVSLVTNIGNPELGEEILVEVGKALTNYTNSEIQLIKGHSCSEVEKILCHSVPQDRKCIVSSENMAFALSEKLIEVFG